MAEKKAEGIPNPYEKYVDLIVQGTHVPPDAKPMRFPTKPVQPVAQPTTTHYNNDTLTQMIASGKPTNQRSKPCLS